MKFTTFNKTEFLLNRNTAPIESLVRNKSKVGTQDEIKPWSDEATSLSNTKITIEKVTDNGY